MLGSFPPSLGHFITYQVYSVGGADAVIQSRHAFHAVGAAAGTVLLHGFTWRTEGPKAHGTQTGLPLERGGF
jgi:hypothetical protein